MVKIANERKRERKSASNTQAIKCNGVQYGGYSVNFTRFFFSRCRRSLLLLFAPLTKGTRHFDHTNVAIELSIVFATLRAHIRIFFSFASFQFAVVRNLWSREKKEQQQKNVIMHAAMMVEQPLLFSYTKTTKTLF